MASWLLRLPIEAGECSRDAELIQPRRRCSGSVLHYDRPQWLWKNREPSGAQ